MWKCRDCKRQFSVKVGTIFEDSPIGLDKWLPALWMIVNHKNGISSHELARALGVTQKTAWFMNHRLRLAMQSNSIEKISGEVEVDETYIGGKARYISKGKRLKGRASGYRGKAIVMGLLERNVPAEQTSRIRAIMVPSAKRAHLLPHVYENIEAGAQVFTDALHSYHELKHSYDHKVIDHAESYAVGNVHTNGLENFWSLLKRGLRGTYVSVEPFHLFRYLDEQCFRFNERKSSDAARFLLALSSVFGKRLTYAALIGNQEAQRN
jgi:transposase-like protein